MTNPAPDRSGRAATVVGVGILLSRLTGLLRVSVFAHYFGAGMHADAYNAALRIPNALRNLFGEGALSAAFVPVYSGLLAKSDEKGARALANAVLGFLLAVVSVLTLIGIWAAPFLTSFLVDGFSPEAQALTTRLARVLFPMSGLMVISGWCLGIQNSHRRFFWSYASAAAWSIAQIVMLVGWGNRASGGVELAWWLSWATLCGSLLQVFVQMPEVLRLLGPIRPSLNRAVEGVAQVMRNIVPAVTALGAVQISSFIDLKISSRLPVGATSNLVYGNTLAMLPVAMFGLSVAASSLPEFSRESAVDAADMLRERLRGGWQRILFYIVPCAVVLAAFGDLCAGMLYETGQFTITNRPIVHAVLAAFAVGLVSYGSVKLLVSAHYALQDYRGPLKASLASIAVSAIVAYSLAMTFKSSKYAVAAVAVGSALGSYVSLIMLIVGLRRRLGVLYTAAMWRGTFRIIGATIAALVAAAPVRWVLRDRLPWIAGPPTLVLFAATFLLVAWYAGSVEASRWLPLKPRPARSSSE